MSAVTVVIPTVPGREESLERAVASLPDDCQIVIQHGYATCGAAWVSGAASAASDYVCFFADDLEAHPGFCEAMCEATDRDLHPAALVLLPNGSKQSCGGAGGDVCRGDCEDWQPVEWSPTPFIRRDWWAHIEPHAAFLASIHYSTDCLISAALAKHGIGSVMRREAVLTHYDEQAGRLGTAGSDGGLFHQYRVEHGL